MTCFLQAVARPPSDGIRGNWAQIIDQFFSVIAMFYVTQPIFFDVQGKDFAGSATSLREAWIAQCESIGLRHYITYN